MSMHNYSNYGHVVKVKELRTLLHENRHEEFDVLYKDGDTENLRLFLRNHVPPTFPFVCDVFVMEDEWESEDLEAGEIYAFFDEDDLYSKTEKPELIYLRKAGVNPVNSRWVSWG